MRREKKKGAFKISYFIYESKYFCSEMAKRGFYKREKRIFMGTSHVDVPDPLYIILTRL